MAEMGGDGGVDHAHASAAAGGVPIGHEFVDVDGRVLPYSLHSLYMLGGAPGALPPGLAEGAGAEGHHRRWVERSRGGCYVWSSCFCCESAGRERRLAMMRCCSFSP